MRKIKKFWLSLLSCCCMTSAVAGFIACETAEAELTLLTPSVTYRVGDNIHLFDLVEYKAEQSYAFTFSIDGEEAESVEGETIYLSVAGVYTIQVTATVGKSVKSETIQVHVYDKVPHMVFKNTEVSVELYDSKLPVAVINLAAPTILCEASHEEYVESVEIYLDEEEPTKVEIKEGVPTADGFYDGRRFHFLYECDYVFTVVSETSGGKTRAQLTVTAFEDFSLLADLDSELSFDKTTGMVEWDAVDGASSYRVKIGKDAVETENTSYDISEYISGEFKYFDLVVVPKDAEGEKLGKMMISDIVIAPEGSEGLVLGRGVKAVDSEARTVTLKGEEAKGAGWKTDLSKFLNSYVAFHGEYGVGTAIEVTFKGNNLPQICFFADELNGNMTRYGGTGWLLMNGLYGREKDPHSSSTTNVMGENVMVVIGPNRISEVPYGNYVTISEHTKGYRVSENTLLTQKALRDDTSNRTYRYTARTFNSSGFLGFEVSLKDDATGAWVVEPTKWVSKDYKVEDITPSSIILYAGVKGDGDDTTFSYNKPYFVEGADQPDSDLATDGTMVVSAGATFNDDGSVTLEGRQVGGSPTLENLDNINANFGAFRGDYGIGTYVDFFFKGNNMPQVMFFADKLNGNVTKNGGTGVLLMNGLVLDEDNGYTSRMDDLLVFGPNRIDKSSGYTSGIYLTQFKATGTDANPGNYPLLTQAGLKETPNANYQYTVGTYAGDDGYLYVEVYLINADTEAEIYHVARKTTLLVEDMTVTEGSIVAYACFNGSSSSGANTTFKYNVPYQKEREELLASGATFNADGSVTLLGRQSGGGVTKETLTGHDNSYVAIKGEYGFGTYMDFYFTGNNMPQVMFFADKINGNITSDGGTGVLLMNGMMKVEGYYDDGRDAELRMDELLAFGPNRITSSYDSGVYLTKINGTGTTNYPGNYPLLSQAGLRETLNANYRYTVGMYNGTDGYLHIDIYLYNADTNEGIYHVDRKTTLAVSDMPVTAGNIVVYAGYKGSGSTTTFKYSQPYTKSSEA